MCTAAASDGTDPPAEVMRRAARAGLDVVALTDHDTVAGHAEARAAAGPVDACCPGMELSCRWTDAAGGCQGGSGFRPRGWQSLHMLAYLFDAGPARRWPPSSPASATTACCAPGPWWTGSRTSAWTSAGSRSRPSPGQAVVGRPHIARAMADSGAIASPREAFTRDWIADGGRAYVGPVRARTRSARSAWSGRRAA